MGHTEFLYVEGKRVIKKFRGGGRGATGGVGNNNIIDFRIYKGFPNITISWNKFSPSDIVTGEYVQIHDLVRVAALADARIFFGTFWETKFYEVFDRVGDTAIIKIMVTNFSVFF